MGNGQNPDQIINSLNNQVDIPEHPTGLEVNCNICKRPLVPHVNVYTQGTKYGMVCNDCGAKMGNGQNPDQIINSLNNQVDIPERPTGLEVNCNICKRPLVPHVNVYTQGTKYGMVCNDCGAKLANRQNPDQIINSLNNQEQRIHCCAVCRGQNNKCKYCWGTGAKDGKHPEPFGPFLGDYPWGSKWGLYDLESEQEYLLNEIKQANINASDNYYPEDGPCVTLNCNNGNCTGC